MQEFSLFLFVKDALVAMEKAMKRDKIDVNDRQLACARIHSEEGQTYLKGMASAANYAWVNRSSMTFLSRQVFLVQDPLFCKKQLDVSEYTDQIIKSIIFFPDLYRCSASDIYPKSCITSFYIISGICKVV